jgi:hypothetical protein
MALRYFHISDGQTTLDGLGTELSDVASVRAEAVRTCRELLNLGHGEQLWDGEPWKVWVTDQPNGAGRNIGNIEITASWVA